MDSLGILYKLYYIILLWVHSGFSKDSTGCNSQTKLLDFPIFADYPIAAAVPVVPPNPADPLTIHIQNNAWLGMGKRAIKNDDVIILQLFNHPTPLVDYDRHHHRNLIPKLTLICTNYSSLNNRRSRKNDKILL